MHLPDSLSVCLCPLKLHNNPFSGPVLTSSTEGSLTSHSLSHLLIYQMTFAKPQLGIFCSLLQKFPLPTAQGSSSVTDAELKNQYYFEEEALINKQSILNQVGF